MPIIYTFDLFFIVLYFLVNINYSYSNNQLYEKIDLFGEVLENINGYDTTVTFAEDIDFYIRCFSKHNLAYHYETCVKINTTVTSSLTQSSTRDKTYPDLTKKLRLEFEQIHKLESHTLELIISDIIN